MEIRTVDFNQVATYWAPLANDGFGGKTFDAPVLITCRFQAKVDLIRSSDGEEVASSHVAYVDRELADNGWLAEGDLTATLSPVGVAHEILSRGSSPSLDGTEVLLKVWL